ncbi:MAG: hypothetical protein ACXAB4_08945, partial [Candidatus Hodarchaeales archaeon]
MADKSKYELQKHYHWLAILLIFGVMVIYLFPGAPILGVDQKIGSKSRNSFVPQNDDWVITIPTVLENQSHIVNGNMLITASGSLTLRNVTLQINSTYWEYYNLTVHSQGQLFLENSTIIPLNPSYLWLFIAEEGCTLSLRGST